MSGYSFVDSNPAIFEKCSRGRETVEDDVTLSNSVDGVSTIATLEKVAVVVRLRIVD